MMSMIMPRSGFTLLEVMVALVVFALAAITVMQAAGEQTRAQGQLETHLLSQWVADNQLALQALKSVSERQREMQGKSELAGRYWFWRSRPLSTTEGQLQAIEITVSDQADFSFSLTQLRAYFSPTVTEINSP